MEDGGLYLLCLRRRRRRRMRNIHQQQARVSKISVKGIPIPKPRIRSKLSENRRYLIHVNEVVGAVVIIQQNTQGQNDIYRRLCGVMPYRR